MNFRENYQREMNEIEKPADITEKILKIDDMEQGTYTDKKNRSVLKGSPIWKTAAAIAIVCVLGLGLQHEKVIGFAQSVLNRFTVSVDHEELEFGEMEAVRVNVEDFIRDKKTKVVEDEDPTAPRSYYRLFTSYQEMNRLTQLELPGARQVEYKNLSVEMTPTSKTGHIAARILHKGVTYNAAGMFVLDGFDQEKWGYGATGSKEGYQYGEGKTACFVKDTDGCEIVYFKEKNILFQMHFNTGDATASKEQTKNLLNLFGQEKE